MEKRVIDIMGRMDNELFLGTELSELELSEEEELALTRMLDLDRIKENARKGIRGAEGSDVQPEEPDLGAARKTVHVKPHRAIRWVACAAAAVLLLGGSVAVAQHLDVFRTFLGTGAVIPQDEVTDVDKSVSKDGVRMTVDSVIAGKNDFVTLLTFELEDGGVFPENAELYKMDVDTAENGVEGALISHKLSQDRKQLTYCIESSSKESMLGTTVTSVAEGLYAEDREEKDLELSLNDYFQKNSVRIALSEEERDAAWNAVIAPKVEKELVKQQKDALAVVMPLSKEYPDLSFGGVGILDGKLFIATYYPYNDEEGIPGRLKTRAVVNKLVDSRTGETYEGGFSGTESYELQGKGIYVAEFDELSESDLPYLKPVVTYIKINVIAEGPWEISFEVEDQGKDVTVKPDMAVDTKKGEVILTEANISPVGGYVIGEWSDAESPEGLPESYATKLSAVTEDGGVWSFKIAGASSFISQEGKNCFKYIYELYEAANGKNRVFLSQDELKQIKKIILDDTEIAMD
ncbi:MAG: DUF4179 domain-containing protein [Eubacteriales bacterium]|nr:DUF4179 domain-containing protein [Eubacteriales bacterium]